MNQNLWIFIPKKVELDDIDDWVKQDYCEENIGINIKSSALGTDNTVGIPNLRSNFKYLYKIITKLGFN